MESYNSIVPSDLQDELLVLRDTLTVSSFRLGDIALQVIAERKDVGIETIYKAVGAFAGKSARTIREYSAIAAFYPVRAREEYSVLSFDHFRTAMRYGERWLEALQWCVLGIDELGRPETVDAMEIHYSGKETALNYEQQKEETNENILLSILRKLKELLVTRHIHLTDDVIDEAVSVINKIEKQLEKVPVK